MKKIYFYKEIDPILNQIHATREERSTARALIYLAAKDYATGIQELVQEISTNNNDKCLLLIACFYQDMADGAAAFYWLGYYYDNPAYSGENQVLWWNYLLQSVAFNYYDDLIPQLLDLYDDSPTLAIKSLSFLYFAHNDHYKGVMLYKEALRSSIQLSKEQYYTFFSSLGYGTVNREHFSYYARYHRYI